MLFLLKILMGFEFWFGVLIGMIAGAYLAHRYLRGKKLFRDS